MLSWVEWMLCSRKFPRFQSGSMLLSISIILICSTPYLWVWVCPIEMLPLGPSRAHNWQQHKYTLLLAQAGSFSILSLSFSLWQWKLENDERKGLYPLTFPRLTNIQCVLETYVFLVTMYSRGQNIRLLFRINMCPKMPPFWATALQSFDQSMLFFNRDHCYEQNVMKIGVPRQFYV